MMLHGEQKKYLRKQTIKIVKTNMLNLLLPLKLAQLTSLKFLAN